jgi:hypothetical protein
VGSAVWRSSPEWRELGSFLLQSPSSSVVQ